MGSPQHELDRRENEGPQHEVTIVQGFAMGRFPVTFDEYDHFSEPRQHKPSDRGWGRGRRPVIGVSWNDAKSYVDRLSQQTGEPYRLLSEAEWEYACRAGTATRYPWGDDAPTPEQANFGNNVGNTTEVGAYLPNPWGLFDMHGNVWEWVEDCWNDSCKATPGDGSASMTGESDRRVLRGGSWGYLAQFLRAATRTGQSIGNRAQHWGFRIARTLC